MPKCDFNKVASCDFNFNKFSEHLLGRTPLGGCFYAFHYKQRLCVFQFGF